MKVECGNCGFELNEEPNVLERFPCPKCGSTTRKFYLELTAHVKAYPDMKMIHKRDRKRLLEIKVGNSYSYSRKKFVMRTMKVDHENNQYLEKVWDSKTGEILRECNEPLSEHRGHGSAMKKTSG